MPMMTAMVLAMLAAGGCVRMNVLPTAEEGTVEPMAQPNPVDKLPVELTRDPTIPYRVGPEDVLRVDVRNDPELNGLYTVTAEGNILLPNIGPVMVDEMTTDEIRENLVIILSEYIKEPDVKVGVQDYLSKIVYVMGQVRRPGEVNMNADQLTVYEAVVAAGLPTTDAALDRTRVITPGVEKALVRQINLAEVLYEGLYEENVLLAPGEIVYIPAKYNTNLAGVVSELLRPMGAVADLYYRSTFYGDYGYGRGGYD
jgi:polysaccharide export outer membrane protein